MATQPELIRQEMASTRAALAQKLNCLEQQVHDKVDSAKSAVRTAFDLPHHVDTHPWAMVGGAAALGYCLGRLLERQRSAGVHGAALGWSSDVVTEGANGHARTNGDGAAPELPGKSAKQGWLGRIAHEFESEIERLKRLAIGAGVGLVRDRITEGLAPEVGAEVQSVLDSVTSKLGGEPLAGPILALEDPNRQPTSGQCT
jgi:ElaB/YqjD/DUF883 family membrane-anchored ribosome-binding protein